MCSLKSVKLQWILYSVLIYAALSATWIYLITPFWNHLMDSEVIPALELPPAPTVDPFSPNFVKYLRFGPKNGPPVLVKCNGTNVRVKPWVKVVDGNKIVFSLPKEVKGDVNCSINELHTWPKKVKWDGRRIKPVFWPTKKMFLHAGNENPAADDHLEIPGPLTNLSSSLQLEKSDFATVECEASLKGEEKQQWNGILTGIHVADRFKNRPPVSKDPPPPSVLILVLDAVSRFAAENAMPLTMAYLRNELEAAVFERHSVVAENSFPNGVAFLTGQLVSDLPFSKRGPIVDYPYIWKQFERKGYVTAYIEDWTRTLGIRANSYKLADPPTDHIGCVYGDYLSRVKKGKCVLNQPSHEPFLNLPEAMWTVG